MNKIFLRSTYVTGEVIEDTDSILRKEFLLETFSTDGEYLPLEIMDGTPLNFTERGYLVNVDTLLEMVHGMKQAGATHVTITQYHDEHSYDINGYVVELINQEEALENFKRTYMKTLEDKRMILQTKLQILEKEIKNLSENGNG